VLIYWNECYLKAQIITDIGGAAVHAISPSHNESIISIYELGTFFDEGLVA
jgi:hypothetical protein